MTAVVPIAQPERRPVRAFLIDLAGLRGLGWAWSLHLGTAGLARGGSTGRGRAVGDAWAVGS